MHKIMPEYQGRVSLRKRAFPLEIFGGGPPDRNELELEIWLAAIQEPEADFKPFRDDWPATTLPAFDGAWCAFQQGEAVGLDFDLRLRRAFFSEGRNIGRLEVVLELAREAGLDLEHFHRMMNSGDARAAVIEEGRLGKEIFNVSSTPAVMLPDGKKLRHPLAFPNIKNGKILSVGKLPCWGEGCYEGTRFLFEQALKHRQMDIHPLE
jgi:hypothetical protein